MSSFTPDSATDRVFDNADSFAMVFDRTWKLMEQNSSESESPEQKLEAVIQAMADHPFVISSPEMARQVATFRIRLLDLS